MITKTIYVVCGYWDADGGSDSWNVIAFETREDAVAHAALANTRHKEIHKKYRREYNEWYKNYFARSASKAILDIPAPLYDPNEFDVGGPRHEDTDYDVVDLTLVVSQ